MPIPIRFQYPANAKLGVSIERLADGLFFDFADSTFKASPGQPTTPLTEGVPGVPGFGGYYRGEIAATAATFPDGPYSVAVHDLAAGLTVSVLAAPLEGGGIARPQPITPAEITAAVADLKAEIAKPRHVSIPVIF